VSSFDYSLAVLSAFQAAPRAKNPPGVSRRADEHSSTPCIGIIAWHVWLRCGSWSLNTDSREHEKRNSGHGNGFGALAVAAVLWVTIGPPHHRSTKSNQPGSRSSNKRGPTHDVAGRHMAEGPVLADKPELCRLGRITLRTTLCDARSSRQIDLIG
jgi:hypothetical protein